MKVFEPKEISVSNGTVATLNYYCNSTGILKPNQNVLEQSAIRIDSQTGDITCQVTINLPAKGRTILGRIAWNILGHTVSKLVYNNLIYTNQKSYSSSSFNTRFLQISLSFFKENLYIP